MISFTDIFGTVSYTYDGNGNSLIITEEKKDGTKIALQEPTMQPEN